MTSWKDEMKLDGALTESEKEMFLEKIEASGIPTSSEYAYGKYDRDSDEVEQEYAEKYYDQIRAIRDSITE